jgi:hypothetical protein
MDIYTIFQPLPLRDLSGPVGAFYFVLLRKQKKNNAGHNTLPMAEASTSSRNLPIGSPSFLEVPHKIRLYLHQKNKYPSKHCVVRSAVKFGVATILRAIDRA